MLFAKKFVISGFVILLGSSFVSVVAANPDQDSGSVQQQRNQQRTPADVFRDGIYELQKFIASDAVNNAQARNAFLNEKIKPKFDMQRMATLVAGNHFKRMTDEQKQSFVSKLEGLFFKGFTEHLVSNSGAQPKVQLLKKRSNKDKQLIDVLARALYPDGQAKRLVFRFANSPKGWRVYDVSADGSSAILYYRQHFTRLAKAMGPEAMLQ